MTVFQPDTTAVGGSRHRIVLRLPVPDPGLGRHRRHRFGHSANALFGTLQQAGLQAGIDPALLVAANTSGGVVGKMISPQNLAIAATSVGLLGRESEIFRKMIFWSLGLLLFLCILVYGQTTFLSWMV